MLCLSCWFYFITYDLEFILYDCNIFVSFYNNYTFYLHIYNYALNIYIWADVSLYNFKFILSFWKFTLILVPTPLIQCDELLRSIPNYSLILDFLLLPNPLISNTRD